MHVHMRGIQAHRIILGDVMSVLRSCEFDVGGERMQSSVAMRGCMCGGRLSPHPQTFFTLSTG